VRGPWGPVLAVALTATLSGCEITPLTPPLHEEAYGGKYCATLLSEGLLAFGAGIPENISDDDVTVTGVELVDAVGMELIGTRIIYVPVDGPGETMGVLDGWPPDMSDLPDLEAAFAEGGEIEGAVIPPSTDTKPSFVVGIRAEPGGHSGPLRVTYRAGDREWTWTAKIRYGIADGDDC